jgi:hypothetical protein
MHKFKSFILTRGGCMKSRLFKPFALMIVLAMLFATVGIGAVSADNARTLSWVVSITYQNVGTDTANVSIDFYPEGIATPVHYALADLNAGAATSLYVGSLTDVTAGFRGSAVMSSTQPLVATVVQLHANAAGETVAVRMLSNGFGDADGSSQFLLATVLANTYSRTTIFSVQNIESETVTATFKFYDTTGTLASTKVYDILAQSTKYIEMDQTSQTGLASSTFNGSAIVTAVMKSDGTTPARVVATENEYYTNKFDAASFEGLPSSKAATTIYLATGLCKKSGLTTSYAVQNSSLTTATHITVSYYNPSDGSLKTTDGPYTIGAGQKKSIGTCSPNSGMDMTGWSGSTIVVSDTTPIVAIGRASDATNGTDPRYANVFTAFNGESGGYAKLALPYVRWANDTHYLAVTNYSAWQRAYLAIQNVSAVSGKVNVSYLDKTGAAVATVSLTIPAGSKGNTDPSSAGALGQNGMNAGEFGYYTNGSYGGGVILQVDPSTPNARFIAIARVTNPGMGEDYNAVSIP